MGTAYIAMVRLDRQQITGSGSGALLVGGTWVLQPNQSLIDQAQSIAVTRMLNVIVQEMFNNNMIPPRLRDPGNIDPPYYVHFLSPITHPWLGDRIPEAGVAADQAIWRNVSGYMVRHDDFTTVRPSGESPCDPAGPLFKVQLPYPASMGPAYSGRTNLIPTSITISYPSDPAAFARPGALTGCTRVYPALKDSSTGNIYLAADADGDGIADSILFRVDVSPQDSNVWQDALSHPVTYYVAWRVIDNNSAINVNTANSCYQDYNFAGGAVYTWLGTFPGNVGLLELLTSGAPANELKALNAYRFANNAGTVSQVPYGDDGTLRSDFGYMSIADALHSQIGRRPSLPGLNGRALCQALGVADSTSLAHRNTLIQASAGSQIETLLSISAYQYAPNWASAGRADRRFPFYPCNSVSEWFNTNFNFDAASRNAYLNGRGFPANYPMSVRSLVTANNPVSLGIQPHDMTVLSDWVKTTKTWYGMPDYGNAPCRASINTAMFGELWRAYWNVMCKDIDPSTWPAESNGAAGLYKPMTRPPGSASAPAMDPYEVLLIRAALASVNALDLRSSTNDVTSRRIVIGDAKAPANAKWEVMVYGGKPQPYITEVYAQTDTTSVPPTAPDKNAKGYVAVELHNPYPFDINLYNWNLGIIDRRPAPPGKYPALSIKPITGFSGFDKTAVVPANGYLILENFGGTAKYRPVGSGLPLTGAPAAKTVTVANLNEVLGEAAGATSGGELVLLRPRRASGDLGKSTNPADPSGIYDEKNLSDLVPLDSFDFSGIVLPDAQNGPQPMVMHYVRASGANNQWKFVYPGKYDGSHLFSNDGNMRQEGTQAQSWDPQTAGEPTMSTPCSLGSASATASYTNPYLPIQLANVDWAGTNKILTAANTNTFPFGGFARLGDILQAPFIGSYRIRQADPATGLATATDGSFLELNPVTQDVAKAEDGDTSDDGVEAIGRFCPGQATPDHYVWATRLFDYFTTITNPNDDYLPNAPIPSYWVAKTDYAKGDRIFWNNTIYQCATAHTSPDSPPDSNNAYWGSNWVSLMYMQPVRNDSKSAAYNMGAENLVGVEGLININTASWKVLSMLPLVLDKTNGHVDVNNTVALAKAIVADRNTKGPFKTIYELNRVPGFQTMMGTLNVATDTPGVNQGDYSGDGKGGTDGVKGDFEKRYLELTRISNLITTRSDTFTAYIVVQAWQDAGTPFPVLVGERRSAFIVDRTGITTADQAPTQAGVPTGD